MLIFTDACPSKAPEVRLFTPLPHPNLSRQPLLVRHEPLNVDGGLLYLTLGAR